MRLQRKKNYSVSISEIKILSLNAIDKIVSPEHTI